MQHVFVCKQTLRIILCWRGRKTLHYPLQSNTTVATCKQGDRLSRDIADYKLVSEGVFSAS